jgi:hypothetical protein
VERFEHVRRTFVAHARRRRQQLPDLRRERPHARRHEVGEAAGEIEPVEFLTVPAPRTAFGVEGQDLLAQQGVEQQSDVERVADPARQLFLAGDGRP